jgi:hypothetical protein
MPRNPIFVAAPAFAAALSLAPAASAQTPRFAPAPAEILLDIVKRHPVNEGTAPRYCCAWIDLNNDKVEEAILWSPAGDNKFRLFDGGNRYDGFEIFQKVNDKYKRIGGGLYGRDNDLIGFLKTRTNGWLDLAQFSFTFGDDKTPRGAHWFPVRRGAKGYDAGATPLKTAPTILLNRANVPSYPV